MQALVKRKAEPGLWLEEVPVPEVGDDDVLVRIKKTSICGTDVHIYNWDAWSKKTIPVPMTGVAALKIARFHAWREPSW